MSKFTPKSMFSPLNEYTDVENWDCEKWRNFCRLLANTFTIVPGIDQDYVDYFWEEFSDHEALQRPTVIRELDDEEDDGNEDEKDGEEMNNEEKQDKEGKNEQQEAKESQQLGGTTNSPYASGAETQKQNTTKEQLRPSEKRTESTGLSDGGQQLIPDAPSPGQRDPETSDVKVVDLDSLSESDIRSISPSGDKSLLILVTLKGGGKAWCNYHLLRTKKQAVGDEMLDILEDEAQNMQNSNVGK